MFEQLLSLTEPLMTLIHTWVSVDPLRPLYLLGGAAGIHYWLHVGQYTPSISIKVIEERCDADSNASNLNVKFSMRNTSQVIVSVEPIVSAVLYLPGEDPKLLQMDLISSDQSLPPLSQKSFTYTVRFSEFASLESFRQYRVGVGRAAPQELFTFGTESTSCKRWRFKLGVWRQNA